jgi:hypothetical protein
LASLSSEAVTGSLEIVASFNKKILSGRIRELSERA